MALQKRINWFHSNLNRWKGEIKNLHWNYNPAISIWLDRKRANEADDDSSLSCLQVIVFIIDSIELLFNQIMNM